MDSSPNTIRVSIFGDDYSIRGDVDDDTTKKVADYVGRKMAETQQNTAVRDKMKVAVLAAMNITGELFDSQDLCRQTESQVDTCRRRFDTIGKKLDAVLASARQHP